MGRESFIIRKLGGPQNGHNLAHHSSSGAHSRSSINYFFFLVSGRVLAEIQEKTYLIKEHELVIIPAGQIFSIKYHETSEGYMGGFHSNFISSENILSKYDFLRIWGSPKIELDHTSFSRQVPLFQRIYEEYTSVAPNYEIIKAYLMAVLAEADSVYRKTIKKVNIHNNDICNKFLEKLFNSSDREEILPANGYAKLMNITPNHLNKVVKGATGKSTSTWIEEAIILKAKLLLKGTSLPLGEIAAKIGIMDQSYFARKFKKHEGISPSEYRQQNK